MLFDVLLIILGSYVATFAGALGLVIMVRNSFMSLNFLSGFLLLVIGFIFVRISCPDCEPGLQPPSEKPKAL